MSLVLDSSVTLAWVYDDETTDPICEVFRLIAEKGAWVPSLWKLEVGNILEMGVRKRRHDAEFQSSTIEDLEDLPIRVDGETDQHAWGKTIELAAKHRLTLYDAAYLELATRRRLPLATLNGELREAAAAEGVILLGR